MWASDMSTFSACNSNEVTSIIHDKSSFGPQDEGVIRRYLFGN
jgi:hypothetical protein